MSGTRIVGAVAIAVLLAPFVYLGYVELVEWWWRRRAGRRRGRRGGFLGGSPW